MYTIKIKNGDVWYNADLPKDTKIAITFAEGDIANTSLKGTGTTNISLPLTPTNKRIFDYAGINCVEKGDIRKVLDARVYCDGILILGSGSHAHILSVTNKAYNIAITAYTASFFEDLKNMEFDSETWKEYLGSQNYGVLPAQSLAAYQTCRETATGTGQVMKINYYPFDKMLRSLALNMGYGLSYDSTNIPLQRYVIPQHYNGKQASWWDIIPSAIADQIPAADKRWPSDMVRIFRHSTWTTGDKESSIALDHYIENDRGWMVEIKLNKAYGTVINDPNGEYYGALKFIIGYEPGVSGDPIVDANLARICRYGNIAGAATYTINEENGWFDNGDGTCSMYIVTVYDSRIKLWEDGEYSEWAVNPATTRIYGILSQADKNWMMEKYIPSGGLQHEGVVMCDPDICDDDDHQNRLADHIHDQMGTIADDILYIDYYCLNGTQRSQYDGALFFRAENMDDGINGLDLYKLIAQALGFITHIENGTITIYNMQDVIGNKQTAKDWTEKMIDAEDQFHSSVAKRNIISIKQNSFDKETQEPDAEFIVNDQLLDKEKNYLTTNIESVYKSGNTKYLDLYKVEEVEPTTGTEYVEVTPKAFYLINTMYGPVTPMMIKANYNKTISILQNYEEIKATFLLNVIDILQYNPTIPIYLKQTGSYYYIKQITNWVINQPCTVELIKLPQN